MADARFEDGAEQPLRLVARDALDLQVIAALVQDAVLTGADLSWQPRRRRFALLLSRFRWEDKPLAEATGRPLERVRSLLAFEDVLGAAHQGLGARDKETVLSLLTLSYEPEVESAEPDPAEQLQPAGPGRVRLVFAGDGAAQLQVECLEVTLSDVTRPYAAPAGRAPDHGALPPAEG